MATQYPVKLNIDYPERTLNRLTSFFRIFAIIPILIILCLLTGPSYSSKDPNTTWQIGLAAGSIIFLPSLLMILFRDKYPRWWFDWNVNITKFSARVFSYFALMTDVYPSTDEEQTVHVEIPYPVVKQDINSGMPVIKWFLAIPHYIVLACLMVAVFFVLIVTWFAILFTGKYPRGLFDFVQGVTRWNVRVISYAFILVTDKYPPFSLD